MSKCRWFRFDLGDTVFVESLIRKLDGIDLPRRGFYIAPF